MKQLNPDWVKATLTTVNSCPYFLLQSMTITKLSFGQARLEIGLQRKHLQPFGLVHGGVFSTLIDAAGWWAAYSELDEGLGMTTVEMKLNYLAPATEGFLVGFGRTIKLGRNLGLAETRIENEDGRLLAHGTVTVMTLPDLQMQGQDSAPAKFLMP